MDISFQSPSADSASASRAASPDLGFATLASTLLGNSQSPFGGIDLNAIVSALLKDFASDTGLLGAVMKELAALLSPLERGTVERLLGEQGPASAAPAAADQATARTSTTLPPRAADSARVPSLERIARNPVVAAAINSAWTASNPNTAGAKVETGFWVVRNDRTGALSVVQFPSNGTRDSLTPGAPPSARGTTVVAFFHTHPNTVAEGYVNGPSPADQNFATANGIPGIIRSHAGMYYFRP
jgi:hypothetical protein